MENQANIGKGKGNSGEEKEEIPESEDQEEVSKALEETFLDSPPGKWCALCQKYIGHNDELSEIMLTLFGIGTLVTYDIRTSRSSKELQATSFINLGFYFTRIAEHWKKRIKKLTHGVQDKSKCSVRELNKDIPYDKSKCTGPELNKDIPHELFPIVLKLLKEEKDKPDPSVETLQALHWAVEELTIKPHTSRTGGGGKVTVIITSGQIIITGRPAFEKGAAGIKIQSGYHRRHIIAWHNLQAAVRNVSQRILDLGGEKELGDLFTNLLTELRDPKDKEPLPKKLNELMEKVLSRLNSNIYNLWPGDGYQNSLINTYQTLTRNWAKNVKDMDLKGLNEWRNEQADRLESKFQNKSKKFIDTLTPLLTLVKSWEPEGAEKPGEQFSKFLLECADNFEVDYPFSEDKAQFKADHEVDNSLLLAAGKFLDWSEGEGLEETDMATLVKNLSVVLNKFMARYLT